MVKLCSKTLLLRNEKLSQQCDRLFAANGLAFNSLPGLSPLPDTMMNRLFARLLDESVWVNQMRPAKVRKKVGRCGSA
ncbi:hypothetical protein BN2476_300068 [Paraburkholderia piptadeniae]|uniref:Uncharacterized protein n=1 Tax=Paraburkholderia piptadeniae TaxID=1701573 RepID=A0A1N7S2D7_9BURK|nr:hypothetical protein [Paraburkholderia piptadeniae]SIT41563.1 hypothetical protein BN2476_300068 [Paraburkholderia piptadeniae]